MHVPYVLTNLGKIKTPNGIHGGIHTFFLYNVTSQATRFTVSVPAQEFYFCPTPQLYMQNVNLGSRLQAKYFHIYIPIYTYFRIKATR